MLFALDETVDNEGETNKEVEEAKNRVGRVLVAKSFENIRDVAVIYVAAIKTLELTSHSLGQ